MKPKQKLPKNASPEGIIAFVEIRHKVRQGLADVERGAIVSLEEAEVRLARSAAVS